jgi:hydroxyethylthiazole kinase-like uncharacterized protein yjeF
VEIVVTSAEMQAYDRLAIKTLKIPGIVLMENAGRSVVEKMIAHYGSLRGKSIVVFCGKGNNGGDGLVIARYLYDRGAKVTIALLANAGSLKKDPHTHYTILKKIEDAVHDPGYLRIVELKSRKQFGMLPFPDVIVDALFGTGFEGTVKGIYRQSIEWMNSQKAVRVSVDVPSGLRPSQMEISTSVVRSDLTITLGYKKLELINARSKDYAGLLEVVDIGIPRVVIEQLPPTIFQVGEADVSDILPTRAPESHKYSVGKVFVQIGRAHV